MNPEKSMLQDEKTRLETLSSIPNQDITSIHVCFQNHDLAGHEMDIVDETHIADFISCFFGQNTVYQYKPNGVEAVEAFSYAVSFKTAERTETIFVYHLGYGSYLIYFDGSCYEPQGDFDFYTAINMEWNYQVQKKLRPFYF